MFIQDDSLQSLVTPEQRKKLLSRPLSIGDKEEMQTPGILGKVGSFLGMEKFGRRLGYGLAGIVSPEYKKNVEYVKEQEQKGTIAPGSTRQLTTGGVSNVEALGSAALTGLSAALPFASKAIAPAGAGLKSLAGRSAVTGGLFGAAGAVEQGKTDLGEIIKQGATTAAIGGVIPPLASLGKYVISRVPKLLGIVTGERHEAIMAALRDPRVADMALQGGDDVLRGVVKEGAKNSLKLKNAFVKGYVDSFDKIIKGKTTTVFKKQSLIKDFEDLLIANDVKIKKGGKLDFVISKLNTEAGEVSKIKKVYDGLRSWKDITPSGLNKLKQFVGELAKFAPEAGGSAKSATLGRFYHNIDTVIQNSLSKTDRAVYIKLNKNFSNNIGFFDDLIDVFQKGDPFTKLTGAIGDSKDTLRQILEFYQNKTGIDVLATVGGRAIAAEKPAAFGLMNPRSWIDFFYSPEMQLKTVTGAGRIQKGFEETGARTLFPGGTLKTEVPKAARQLVYPQLRSRDLE